jgi:hypothetical protein
VPRQAEPTGRCIYQYFDGQQQRFIDPLDVVRRLPKIAYFDPAKDPILCDQDDFDAMERTARASSELFGVKPLGEGGLTEAERIQLLFNFLLWWDGLKKNTATSPSTSPPQAPPPVA